MVMSAWCLCICKRVSECVCVCARALTCLQSFCTKLYMTLLWFGCHSSVYLSLLTNQIALKWFSPQRRRWDVITALCIFPLMCRLLSGNPGAKQSRGFQASLGKIRKINVPTQYSLTWWFCRVFESVRLVFTVVQAPPDVLRRCSQGVGVGGRGLRLRMKIKEAAGQGQPLHLFTQTAIIHYHLSVSAEILLPQHCWPRALGVRNLLRIHPLSHAPCVFVSLHLMLS